MNRVADCCDSALSTASMEYAQSEVSQVQIEVTSV